MPIFTGRANWASDRQTLAGRRCSLPGSLPAGGPVPGSLACAGEIEGQTSQVAKRRKKRRGRWAGQPAVCQ